MVAGTLKPRTKETQSAGKSTPSAGAIGFFQKLGPGLVTGASDDDPSGIGTYSQVGAQFGYGLLWTMVLSYPLMAAIQEISARIGRVTGAGIAANLRKNYPKPLLYAVLFVVSVANVFNLGADMGAMGAATQLVLLVRSELAELARAIKDGAKERRLYAAIRPRLGWPARPVRVPQAVGWGQ